MLPGMRCAVEASNSSALEQRRKWLGRMAGLRAAQAECDHALRARLNRHVDRVRRPTPRLGLATLREVGKVAEAEPVAELLGRGIGQVDGVPLGQRKYGCRSDGALEMEVQLGLGRCGQVGLD